MSLKLKQQGYYVDIANKYIEDVLSGKQVACKWVKLACLRQKSDLNNKEFEYTFDLKRAEKICRFAEMIKHVNGEMAGQYLILQPWQCFIYTTIFGWVNKNGKRRFRDVYTEIARKNGKSFFSIPVALYMLALDGEAGSQVYIAASQMDQTKHIWEPSLSIVNNNRDLRSGLGLNSTKYSIFKGDCFFQRLVRDSGGNNDGSNPHCALIDELHAHKTRDTHDSIVSGTAARSQPLVWRITTAGYNRAGVCYEQNGYVKKILLNQHVDDSYFGIIFTLDDDDDFTDPTVWVKSNPNLDISVPSEYLQKECNKAVGSSSSLNNFLTKNLNVWVNAESAWMNMVEWNKCKDEKLKIEDFKNDPCFIGCDLASKLDFACVSKVFVRKINNKTHYYAFVDHYLNERAIEESKNDQIDGWVVDGWLTSTQGTNTDFERIRDDIGEFYKEYNVKAVAFDPSEAFMLRKELLDNYKIESDEYNQNTTNMSEPTFELEAIVKDGRFHHNGDPILEWMISNVVAKINAKNQIHPKRDINNKDAKIDGAIATIIAIGRYLKDNPKSKVIEPQIFIFNKNRA